MGINPYLKAIVAFLSAISIALETAYPNTIWAHTVTAGIGAILVYLVPNLPRAPRV